MTTNDRTTALLQFGKKKLFTAWTTALCSKKGARQGSHCQDGVKTRTEQNHRAKEVLDTVNAKWELLLHFRRTKRRCHLSHRSSQPVQ